VETLECGILCTVKSVLGFCNEPLQSNPQDKCGNVRYDIL